MTCSNRIAAADDLARECEAAEWKRNQQAAAFVAWLFRWWGR